MKNKKRMGDFFKVNFNYREDEYDKLKWIEREKEELQTMKGNKYSYEYDYEEDLYEPYIEEDEIWQK